jgi:hypothetical protein
MDASGLKRTRLVEVGLGLHFGLPARCLIGSTLGYPPPVTFLYLYIQSAQRRDLGGFQNWDR